MAAHAARRIRSTASQKGRVTFPLMIVFSRVYHFPPADCITAAMVGIYFAEDSGLPVGNSKEG
jgi:hypothetical protein